MAAVEAAAIFAFNVLKVFNVLKAKGSRLNHFGYLAVYSVIKRSMSFFALRYMPYYQAPQKFGLYRVVSVNNAVAGVDYLFCIR